MSTDALPAARSRRRFLATGAATVAGAAALPLLNAGPADAAPGASPRPRPNVHGRPNSASFVDVTQVDGRYVTRPVIATTSLNAAVARENAKRIRAVLTSPHLGPDTIVYFPAGHYYFGEPDGDWTAQIQTTHPRMTVQGDGETGTILYQTSRRAVALVQLSHEACAVQDLAIRSSDRSDEFKSSWSTAPHQAAIALTAPSDTWYPDPRIERVAINTEGNNIVTQYYYRPFNRAIEISGPWLNVYVDTMFIADTITAIHVVQGTRIAGPAKFIAVNCYAAPPDKSSVWTTFFASETYFMEQVELIHCTFIGSQFVNMDGEPGSDGSFVPVYDMVIDHNYINCVWVTAPSKDYKYSGVYLRLPPSPDGANHSRDIRFTNNSVTAGLPDRPAFFYLEGVCRGVTFSDNDVSSGAMDRCIYIRGSERYGDEDIAVRDVKITDNYFRNFARPIAIGGDAGDPTAPGPDDDPYFTDRVLVSGNETLQEPGVEALGLTTIMLNRCRKAVVEGNSLFGVSGTAISLTACESSSVGHNGVLGLSGNSGYGVLARSCSHVALVANTTQGFAHPITAMASKKVTLSANVVTGGTDDGLTVDGSSDVAVTGNVVDQSKVGLTVKDSSGGAVTGNRVVDCATASKLTGLRTMTIVANAFDGSQAAPSGSGLVIRSNIGLADN